MPAQKGYRDACGMAMALDLVGERWALLVVRELLLGPKRFTDLHRALAAASPNVLSDRLRELGTSGIVRRHQLPPPAASWVYELTDWGRELEPILLNLGTWALRSGHTPDDVRGHRAAHAGPNPYASLVTPPRPYVELHGHPERLPSFLGDAQE